MKTPDRTTITVMTKINSSVEQVWRLWTEPKHITHWNIASNDWITPKAENDLRPGGKFLIRMEARDGSTGFYFTGVYDKVEKYKELDYTIADGRKVRVLFSPAGNVTTLTESFDPEHFNTPEIQKAGWQSILDNFKEYVETTKDL